MSDRLIKLLQLLERDPKDAFVLYGIAMEHKKAGDAQKAIEFFNRTLQTDGGYCYAYHQKGLVYESLGDVDSARKSYQDGIEAARKKGDAHAAEEIAAALSMLA